MRLSSDSRRSTLAKPALWGAAIVVLGTHAVVFPSAASYPPSAEGTTAAASTDHSDATRAALDVMANGGNAIDGAIAAALALGVVNPSASGIGGGGFALVYSVHEKKVSVFDFRETAPSTFSTPVLWPPKKPDDVPRDKFGWTGPRGGSVGVPGELAGLELLSRRYGKKSLVDDAAPAVSLAQNGFFLGKHTADLLEPFQARLSTQPSLAASFLPGGKPAAFMSRVRRPELAQTLVRFGREGKKPFYEGDIAQKIVEAARAAGSTLTREDVAGYQVQERKPLTRTVDGRTIFTMPAPSAGGLMLLETLSMFGASKSSALAAMGFGSSAYLHTVAEAMRGAIADRARLAGDPDLDPNVEKAYAAALEPAQIAARKKRIDPNKTHAPVEFKTKEQGTSHLVVTDPAGNVVSLTTTVNGPFGASIVAGDTGMLLNNELDDFTSEADAKAFGLNDGGPNRPRARARPVSSMTPAIVFENDVPILAVGGSGGPRIATGVTQATLARLLFDLDPNACVSHPRVHTSGSTLFVEPEIAADVRDGLAKRGETVKEEPWVGSAMQMITWTRAADGRVKILAASDPRKAGFAAAR